MYREIVKLLFLCATQSLSSGNLLDVRFGASKADFEILVNGLPWLREDLSQGKVELFLNFYFFSNFKYIFSILSTGNTFPLCTLGEISVTSKGETYTTLDQSLRLESEESPFKGHDILGSFSSHRLHWSPSEIGFETRLRIYEGDDLLVFTQHFQVIETLKEYIVWYTTQRAKTWQKIRLLKSIKFVRVFSTFGPMCIVQ